MCTLHAEDVYLLPVVFGEVPQLSEPGTVAKYFSITEMKPVCKTLTINTCTVFPAL